MTHAVHWQRVGDGWCAELGDAWKLHVYPSGCRGAVRWQVRNGEHCEAQGRAPLLWSDLELRAVRALVELVGVTLQTMWANSAQRTEEKPCSND